MFSILESIGNLIVGLVNFLINAVTSIINILGMVPQLVTFVGTMLAMLPSFVIPFITLSIAIMVIVFVKTVVL